MDNTIEIGTIETGPHCDECGSNDLRIPEGVANQDDLTDASLITCVDSHHGGLVSAAAMNRYWPGFKHSPNLVRHNRAMRVVQIVCLALSLTPGLIGAGTTTHVPLKLGQQTTLHVGQITVLRLSSDHPYSVTLEGDAVVSLKAVQIKRTYSYRTIRAGNASLLPEARSWLGGLYRPIKSVVSNLWEYFL